jgi:hypothetical protein
LAKPVHAIVLLPAGIKQHPPGTWCSTNLSEADDRLGAPGGKLRVLAAVLLLRTEPDAIVITGGGKGADIPEGTSQDRPPLAQIIRDELLAEGISRERIKLEWTSNSTYQELVELQRMSAELGVAKLTFITNRYALPRLQSIIQARFPRFGSECELGFAVAEEILTEADPLKWERQIREAYASEYLKRRIAKEEAGIQEIRAGTYRYS